MAYICNIDVGFESQLAYLRMNRVRLPKKTLGLRGTDERHLIRRVFRFYDIPK